MKQRLLLIACLLLCFFWTHAQSDLCQDATQIVPSGTCVTESGSFSSATLSGSAPVCGPNASQDVWYQFTATDPVMSVSVSPNNNLNVGFEVLTGSCAGASLICVNQNGGGFSEFYTSASFAVGETYYVRVFNSSASLSTGSFFICVQNYPAPANDLCADAQLLTTSLTCTTVSGFMSGAMVGTPAVCGPNASQDVWYQFTATDPVMSVSVSPNNNLNVGFEILSGSCAGASIICVNQNGGGFSEFYTSASFAVGETYYVRVFNSSASLSTGSFFICVQNYPTPANDLCADAQLLTPSLTCNTVSGFMSGAMMGTPAVCGPNASQDVWYQFTATDPVMSVSVSPNNNLNVGFEILSGSCVGTSMICVNQNGGGFSEFYTSASFAVGETYYVRVFNSSASLSTGSFFICVQNYPTPANDLCADAQLLTPSLTCTTVSGSMSGAMMGTPAVCGPNASQDVWYQFTATDPVMSVSVSPNNNLNVGFEILSGSCAGASMICVNQNGGGFSEFYTSANFAVGETYYIRVFNSSSSLSTGSFVICVQNYPTPENDLCADAQLLTPSLTCNTVSGFMSGAMMGTPAVCGPNASQDVWYQFTATDPVMSVSVSPNNNLNVGFEILSGSCAGASMICVNQNGGGFSEFYTSASFAVGETYYVRVFNSSSSLSTGSFVICVQNYPTPANDLCADATPITPTNTCVGTAVSFSGAMVSGASPACAVNTSQDVWYSFVAPLSTMTVALTVGNSVNHGFELYENSCAASPISCTNQNGASVSEQAVFNNLTVGNTYYVRVFNTSSSLTTAANFTICVFNNVLSVPGVDANKLRIYPNPVESVLYLSDATPFKTYSIVNALGQVVQSGISSPQIAVDTLPRGTYWIRLSDDSQTTIETFVKN